MPYARRTRANGLRGTGAVTRGRATRKRGPNIAKVKYQAPTARHQRAQILANARTLARHARLLRQHKVFTDWQYVDQCSPAVSGDWAVRKLTDFSLWQAVMRQSEVVDDKSHTFSLRSQVNIRVDLGTKDFCAVNVFIVTKRKNATQYDPFTTAPQIDTDYIENTQQQGFNLRLNPALYKVHFARYATLTQNALFDGVVATQNVGDPRTTYRKWQVTVPWKMSITQPALTGVGTAPWKNMNFENLPPWHQYFMLVNMSWGGAGTSVPSLNFDQLATNINNA